MPALPRLDRVVGPLSAPSPPPSPARGEGVSLAIARSAIIAVLLAGFSATATADHVKDLQTQAITEGKAHFGYWGAGPEKYSGWTKHSNRLIPVYTFGIALDSVRGERSVYRDADRLAKLYGRMPADTINPQAEYFDQTDICQLQRAAAAAGKKYIVLIVFDGMDWQTTRAAAVHRSGKVGYSEGRGTGLYFLDYRAAPTDFGYIVTSPHNDGTEIDADAQTVRNAGGKTPGGYNAVRGGPNPWTPGSDPAYVIGQSRELPHAVTDSAASATSLCAGIKTYNDAVNVDAEGRQVPTVAHELQARGFAIGVVTSVPISHATPACAYAHNVSRDDFQDIARDLVGLPSVAHRRQPLAGVDVLLGAGWGADVEADAKQGVNFAPGNKYIAAADVERIDAAQGGRYVVARRQSGANGRQSLAKAAAAAARDRKRLFGMFGAKTDHLPFATADGKYDPTIGARRLAEVYTQADLDENPTLADMARAALAVLESNMVGFWLMIEAGEVDWANHDDNIDNSIGAVKSGDEAFRAVVEWVEARNAWDQTVVILTADHGHDLNLIHPADLLPVAGVTGTADR
ncbi:MAG: alkaline phosphatase [Planctomycetia bacterium]|nr:alkaline phosphatase [Planctomycetia bacterium]